MMKYVNGAQIILMQMIQARTTRGYYASGPCDVVGGPFLDEAIGKQVHASINRRARYRCLPNHSIRNAFNPLFLRKPGEPLPNFMIRRLGECYPLNDHGSRERVKVFRRILRKHYPERWVNLPLPYKYSGSTLQLAIQHRHTGIWRLKKGLQTLAGTFFPAGWPLKVSEMGKFEVTLGDKVFAQVLPSQVRRQR